jgi:hypothetical protein
VSASGRAESPPPGGSGFSFQVLGPPSLRSSKCQANIKPSSFPETSGRRPCGLSTTIPHAASQPPAKFKHHTSRLNGPTGPKGPIKQIRPYSLNPLFVIRFQLDTIRFQLDTMRIQFLILRIQFLTLLFQFPMLRIQFPILRIQFPITGNQFPQSSQKSHSYHKKKTSDTCNTGSFF